MKSMETKAYSIIEEAYKELDKLSADEKKRLEYEARQKAIRDRDILIKTGENRGRIEIILSVWFSAALSVPQEASCPSSPSVRCDRGTYPGTL